MLRSPASSLGVNVLKWLNPPHGESLGTKAIHLAGAANSGDLKSEKLLPFPEDIVLEEIAYRDLVIVVRELLGLLVNRNLERSL